MLGCVFGFVVTCGDVAAPWPGPVGGGGTATGGLFGFGGGAEGVRTTPALVAGPRVFTNVAPHVFSEVMVITPVDGQSRVNSCHTYPSSASGLSETGAPLGMSAAHVDPVVPQRIPPATMTVPP